jgi:hypothetical protein
VQELTEYSFERASRSRFAKAVSLVMDENVFAVRLIRGEDFPDDVKIKSVQRAVGSLIRKRGRSARTFIESENAIILSLWPEGEAPSRPTRRRRSTQRQAPVAA